MLESQRDPFLVSASGMTAQRLRLDLIAGNLANANSTRTESGEPYRRKLPVLQAIPAQGGPEGFWVRLRSLLQGRVSPGERPGPEGGVMVDGIVEDRSSFVLKHEPGHPDAGPDGYVRYPNVDPIAEMVDLIAAQRAYEANASAMEAARKMALRALEIGRI